jgi:hypothetical protein
MGNPEAKRPQGRPRCRWENNTVTYLINALPSNDSVNKLNNRETVFYGVRSATVAIQRRGKYASTTIEAVFSVESALRLNKESDL